MAKNVNSVIFFNDNKKQKFYSFPKNKIKV